VKLNRQRNVVFRAGGAAAGGTGQGWPLVDVAATFRWADFAVVVDGVAGGSSPLVAPLPFAGNDGIQMRDGGLKTAATTAMAKATERATPDQFLPGALLKFLIRYQQLEIHVSHRQYGANANSNPQIRRCWGNGFGAVVVYWRAKARRGPSSLRSSG
jgi:hypothetical protein